MYICKNIQYAKEKLKRIPLDVQKDKYEQIKQAADASGDLGICPYCDSSSIKVHIMDVGGSSTNFHCKNCNEFAHIDGRPPDT